MNNREYFHESVVKDVVDILTSAKDYDEVQFIINRNNHRSFKSISAATKDLILTFPMLASADLDPANVAMAAKAHEKKCAAMLHILFTAICVGENEDVYDFVKKFHSNLGTLDATLDDYMEALDKIAQYDLDEAASMQIDKDALNAVLEDLKQSNYTLPDDINESAISDFKIVPGYRTGYKNMVLNEGPEQDREAISKRQLNYTDIETKRVLNGEYKKANELMPTMMVVNFIGKNEYGTAQSMTCTIGIKVKVYPVSTADVTNRIISKVQDRNILNSFIRATTNDIAFFRDFIFAIDKAKLDAVSYGKASTSNKMWKVLERRSLRSKFRRSFKMVNDATAITSLCISEDCALAIKESSGIDIMNTSTARKILDAYNFMAIIVLNEAVEVANFLYDTGDDSYERLTFSNMEREASDNSYKKMVNLLAKVSR